MATLNFPDDPTTGDEYYDSNAGFNYEWNGTVWITKNLATPDNTREIDDISSGFDGSDTTFTLKVEGVNIVPQDVKQLVISVGGVMQNPGDDYTVSGSTLTFTTAPLSGLSFVGTFLGVAASLNTITAGTVSPSSLTATSNYTVGSIKVSGASTIGNFVLTGLTTITDPDVTNLSSSGVGTVSNVIITGDNSGLGATVGAAVGVVTYFGDASNMTGVGLSIFPLSYGPGIGSTSQAISTDITTTWNYPLQAGSGTITIRTGGVEGTIVDQFVVGSSSSITISERTLTLNPAADLAEGTEHFVVYPAGAIKSTSGQKENNQLVTSFTTLTVTRQLWGWGNNEEGALGLNQEGNRISSPTQLPGTNWERVVQCANTAHATKTDGTLWGWGNSANGNLGLNQGGGSYVNYSSPTQIGTDTTWNKLARLSRGGDTAGATKTDGTLWTWGSNFYGQLGHNQSGAPSDFSSPTQVPGTTWDKISISGNNPGEVTVATKTDGTLWAMGYGEIGGLGQNDNVNRSSPVQIGGTTWANSLASKRSNALAVKTDGTLWAWGENNYGNLGQNQTGSGYPGYTAAQSSPVQIPGTTWSTGEFAMATAQYNWMVIKTDGTLWSWGSNESGMLGLNQYDVHQSSPCQLPGTTWSSVSYNYSSGYKAIKTDGTLWTWGNNGAGQLGQNEQNPGGYSSPVQVPGTDWVTGDLGGNFVRKNP